MFPLISDTCHVVADDLPQLLLGWPKANANNHLDRPISYLSCYRVWSVT